MVGKVQKERVNCVFLMILFSGFYGFKLQAQDLKASLAIVPGHSERHVDGKPTGGFVDLVVAIDDVYEQGNISVKLYPFARSLNNIEKGYADFHMPLIKLPHGPAGKLPFAYVSECVTQVAFVLYTRADAPPLARDQLEQYQNIETVRGHKQLFPFNVIETNSIHQGIKKLIKARNDSFIMEQDAVDDYIKQHQIKNIRRTLYAVWDSCVVIPKGPRQNEIDKIISTALRKLKASGRLKQITQTIHQPYLDWQPYLMKW